MEKPKISFINQEISLKAFVTIIKKQLWVVLLLLAISIFGGNLFIRYSLPLYKTSSTIQIKSENRTGQLLGFGGNDSESKGLASAIELLKSNDFLRSVIADLPLDVTYYMQGKVIDTEIYENTPFKIEYKIINPKIYNTKIDIDIINEDKCEISYIIKNIDKKCTLELNSWQTLDDFEICVNILNKNGKNDIYKNLYSFIINDTKSLLQSIKNRLEIETVRESSGAIVLTYQDYNANKATDIINAIANKFLAFDIETKRKRSDKVIEYIDFQIENIQNSIGSSEQNLEDFMTENNMSAISEVMLANKSNSLVDQIKIIESKLLDIDFELATLEDVINRINSEEGLKIYEIFTILAGKQSESIVSSLINSIHSLTTKKELLLFDITENTSKIKIIDKQIEERKQTVIEFIEFIKVRLVEQKEKLQEKLQEIENKLYSKVENKYNKLEYANLKRLIQLNQDYYSRLLQAKLETLIAQAGYITNNTILEKASVPDNPFFPDFNKIMLIAVVIGLILSTLFCFVKYLFYSKIISTNDITNYTNIPVLSSIPHISQKMENSEIIVHLRPKSVLTESFRNIRTKLDFFPIEDKCRVITVSSTIAAEGKTLVALNLATIYAMGEKKTIIIDLDLRKPRIHKSFYISNSINNSKGISTVLTNQNTLQECINHSNIENLDYITSGPVPPNPAELVISERYKNLINELKNIYDIIIIDTPPIGIVIDAIYSYKLSHNQIYVMRSQFSNRNVISNINQIQETHSLKNLLIVLNDVKNGSVSNHSGYYYNNKSYYEEGEEKQKNFLTRIFKRKK